MTSNVRCQGIGKELIREALRRFVSYPCTLEVETFGLDHPGARSRAFYERLGFHPADDGLQGPDGSSRQALGCRSLNLPPGLPDYPRTPGRCDTGRMRSAHCQAVHGLSIFRRGARSASIHPTPNPQFFFDRVQVSKSLSRLLRHH